MKSKAKITVGLVDADLLNGGTRHPNLVLLKLAGFLRDNDIKFHLIIDNEEDISDYHVIYMSKVFSFTPGPPFYERGEVQSLNVSFTLVGRGTMPLKKTLEISRVLEHST